MKIFIINREPINPPYDDGAKNIVMGVAKRLKEHHFYFISSLFDKAFSEQPNVNFIRSPFQKIGGRKMSFCQKVFIFIISLLKIKKIDVFQFFFAPQTYFSQVYNRLIKRYNKKSIQTVTSICTLYAKNPERTIRSLFFTDYVVVHSEYAKKRLTDAGVKNIVRIYPGVDLERFNIKNLQQESLHPKAILQNDFNIIYPGTYKILNESYSFENFFKIALSILEKSKNIRFIMACRIRTREDLVLERKFKALAEKFNIRKFFGFLNKVDDMPSLLHECDIGIMPAKKQMIGILEIPLVLLELAALEKPAVYGNVPPLNELNDKGLGLMVNDVSPEAYMRSLLQFLEDKELASEIGRRSRDAVIKHFNIDNTAFEYKRLYNSLK